MTVRYYSSQAVETTLASAITSSDTTITLTSTTGYPAPNYPFTIIIDPDIAGSEEVVEVTGAGGGANQFVITRGSGVDGSTAVSHASGAVVKHGVSARDFKNSRDHENATTGVHGVTGSIAPLASPTFTGTVAGPIINATTKFQVNGTDVTGLTGAWSSWTPTITGWGGANYTVDAKYIQIGKTVHFSFLMAITGANSGTSLAFTLPATSRTANNLVSSASFVSAGNQFIGICRNGSTTVGSVFALNVTGSSINTANLTSTIPATWANGDAVRVTGTYEAA